MPSIKCSLRYVLPRARRDPCATIKRPKATIASLKHLPPRAGAGPPGPRPVHGRCMTSQQLTGRLKGISGGRSFQFPKMRGLFCARRGIDDRRVHAAAISYQKTDCQYNTLLKRLEFLLADSRKSEARCRGCRLAPQPAIHQSTASKCAPLERINGRSFDPASAL
jgi:hypothetical protein